MSALSCKQSRYRNHEDSIQGNHLQLQQIAQKDTGLELAKQTSICSSDDDQTTDLLLPLFFGLLLISEPLEGLSFTDSKKTKRNVSRIDRVMNIVPIVVPAVKYISNLEY